MKTIRILEHAGAFAENKDVARDLRLQRILPAVAAGEQIVLDFAGVGAATQSFIHALISDVLRQHGDEVLDQISFKSCSETVEKIIRIVTEYMQEGD